MLHILWGILLAHWSLTTGSQNPALKLIEAGLAPRTCGEANNGLIICPIKHVTLPHK